MKNRIELLFERKQERVVNIYFTAGYPHLEDTLPLLRIIQESGIDLAEIGMPYSDPLADGPVIQQSSMVAIANGMTIDQLFRQLQPMRNSVAEGGIGSELPVILMGYLNPVLQYGMERFCADAAAAGVDGLILPDLPVAEYQLLYQSCFKKYGLELIFLVTPETSEERIRLFDQVGGGFLYAVSSSSTTGQTNGNTIQPGYLNRLKQMKLRLPVLVGFGIRSREDVTEASRYANGAIIGSAFIRALRQPDADALTHAKTFLNELL